MDPTVQIDPERCVLVIGPQIAAAVLPESVPRVLSYALLVDLGVQKMLEHDGTSTYEEKSRKHSLMVSAYELEPAFAASKVVDTLREHGIYQQWLNDQFGKLLPTPVHKSGGIVDKLHSLQEKGALLVYTYYDTILDGALNSSPILPEDEEAVKGWASHQNHGLLHIHGTYTQSDSVGCDCVNYRRLIGESSGGQILKEACRNRSVLFFGFDGEFYDPFIPKFAKTFLGPSHPPPVFISSVQDLNPSLDAFLTLRLSQLSNLENIFFTAPPLPRLGVRDAIDRKISTTLLYQNKASCLGAAERVKVTSGINVHQLTMTHEHLHHHLLLYLDRDGLRELWKIVFPASPPSSHDLPSPSLGLQNGLLGIMIDSIVVWLKRMMATSSTTTSASYLSLPMDTGQGSQEYMPFSAQHHIPRSLHPPSLTTNVALIGSTGTPIVTPSVSKSCSSTRPTLPSPLISSTSRALPGGVTTKGSGDVHMNLLSPLYSPCHGPVRRVQSERTHLSYKDRLTKLALKKNGILLHTESAPNFIRTSEGVLAYIKDPIISSSSHVSSVTHPSSLLKDGTPMEVKIERVDQMQHVTTTATAASVSNSDGSSHDHRVVTPTSNVKEFVEERQKFISEAQNWSKLVGSEIEKKSRHTDLSSTCPSLSLGGQLPLSLFTSYGAPGHTSLSSKFSQEERERLLQQHFEWITQQQQHQQQAASVSFTPPAVSLSKLPLNAISGSTTTHQGHNTHSPQHLSPLQLSHPGRTPSPKKSPINPFQPSTTSGTSGVLPFLSQAASLNPANFLCNNTSLSQFPAASMFNPIYQVALQQLLSPQIKGKQPVMVSDPLALQNFMSIILPDGTVTLLPTTAATPSDMSSYAPTASTHRNHHDSSPAANKEDARDLKLPLDVSHNPKRTRSPDADPKPELRGSLPKRRRSCSLPDITQLSQVSSRANNNEDIKEEEKEEMGGVQSRRRIPASTDEPRPSHLAPPTMIHIPQDMKMNDPMLGFPTPPQSSPPIVGNFAVSPIVFSAPTFHPHQPMTPITPGQDSEELRDLVEAGGFQAPLPPSPEGSSLPPFPAGRGPIQLWQFLLDLLLSPDQQHMIHWTGNGYEFKILQPEEIAKLWGTRKNKPRMNYDKLSRGLRYYYSKGIMDKVQGKKLTFKYTCDVQNYVNSRNSQSHGSSSRGVEYRGRSESSTPVASAGRTEGGEEEMGVASDGERSFGVLDLGFNHHHHHHHRDAKKASETLSGMVGVVQDAGSAS